MSRTGDEAGQAGGLHKKALPVSRGSLSSSRRHRTSFVLGGSTMSPSVRGDADPLGGTTAPAQSVGG